MPRCSSCFCNWAVQVSSQATLWPNVDESPSVAMRSTPGFFCFSSTGPR
jgi:hypothetical protein